MSRGEVETGHQPRTAGKGPTEPRARGTQILLAAPWLRAPLLLRRAPGVVVALVVATAILGVAAASGPLFLSSAGSATLTRAVESGCVERSRPTVANPAVADMDVVVNAFSTQLGPRVEVGDRFVTAAMRQIGLPAPYRVLVHSATLRPGTDSVNDTATLYSRADALEHVEIVEQTGDIGVWLTDRYAGVRGLRAGDTLQFAFGDAPIAGIYRDLAGAGVVTDLPAYWCTWSDLIVPTLEARPPPFVLIDPETLFSLVPAVPELGETAPEILGWWYSPVDAAALSLAEGQALVAQADQLTAELRRQAAQIRSGTAGYIRADEFPAMVQTAEQTGSTLRGPVVPVALAATLVALLLVLASGGLWVAQRAREVELLRSRGVPNGLIGVKAVLEVLPPAVVGGLVGWAGAAGLIALVGPSPLVDPGALGTAAQTVGAASAVGLLALGLVAAVGSARRADRPHRRFRPLLLPWELTFLAAAWYVYRRAAEGGGATSFGESVALNPLLVAFPMLALLGGLLLAARLLSWLLPLARRRSPRWRPAGWLSIRSLTSGVGVVLTVFVLTAVPIGVLAYSAGLTDSLATSVAAKSGTYNGADQAFDLRANAGVEPTPDVAGLGTYVNVVKAAHIGDRRVQLLGIEPEVFAAFASWDDGVIGGSPEELLAPLRGDAGDTGPLPALLIGDPGAPVTEVDLFGNLLPVEVVRTATTFPGLRTPTQAMVVVDRDRLDDLDRYAQRQIEVWTDSEHADALVASLAAQGVQLDRLRTPDAFVSAVDLLPVTWAFDYLQTIATLTGLIAITALLLYLAVRQRQRFASYHLSRRMGLSAGSHVRALAAEVAMVLGGAWVAGVGLGLLCVLVAYRLLELNPTFPPPPAFGIPVALLGVTAAGVVIATVIAALVGHAVARSTRAGEVLRLS